MLDWRLDETTTQTASLMAILGDTASQRLLAEETVHQLSDGTDKNGRPVRSEIVTQPDGTELILNAGNPITPGGEQVVVAWTLDSDNAIHGETYETWEEALAAWERCKTEIVAGTFTPNHTEQ